MLTKDLVSEILTKPARDCADTLYIVSGYATATMGYFHLDQLKRVNKNSLQIKLIVGMCATEGIGKANHLAFQRLVKEDYPDKFECRYLIKPPPVHAKVYTWIREGKPFVSFIGSANYTQNGFGKSQRESMASHDAREGLVYYSSLRGDTVDCCNPKIDKFIPIFDEREVSWRRRRPRIEKEEKGIRFEETEILAGLPSVSVSLLDHRGDLPSRSGLNWGQRPEYNREPNQAYIKLPSEIYKSNFFPEIGKWFAVRTDDGKAFVCVRAQQNGKAIETPKNNSLLGKYFRKRLGLPPGSLVELSHLLRSGRATVDFYKIDDETFYLDFSKKKNG